MSKKEWALMIALWVMCLGFCDYRLHTLDALNTETVPEISAPETITEEPKEVPCTYLGDFTITHYCACSRCCGKSNGITASGTVATPERTIAVDPSVIPLGSVVLIDGIYYIAEDTGGAIKGNRIDICMATHDEAVHAGVKVSEVYLVGMEARNNGKISNI